MVRSKFHIMKDILIVAAPKGIENKEIEDNIHGASKTYIMNACGLSFRQRNEYLSFLKDIKLLEKDKYFELYVTTEKGLAFLESFNEIQEFSTK